jgi:hypothetical protein
MFYQIVNKRLNVSWNFDHDWWVELKADRISLSNDVERVEHVLKMLGQGPDIEVWQYELECWGPKDD